MPGLGIGAAGVLGVAFEVLTPPVVISATPIAGGTLTAGTYKYYVTATNANGETTISNEVSGTTASSNLTLQVTWSAVPGATGYKVYRTAIGGATGSELLLATLGNVTSYNDTAPGTPTGAFPTANTAFNSGTYTAPTKYIPFNSETLKYQQANVYRRPIRQSAGIIGAVPGNSFVDGDIEFEATEDTVIWLMYAARTSITKSGSSNYTYTVVPSPNAIPVRTLSISIDRDSGVVFGYTGCVVSAIKFSINNGELVMTASIVGTDESSQAALTPTWPTTTPFGAGTYSIEFPTGTPVFDTDMFEFTMDDQAVPQYRLKNTGRSAQFINFGERNCTLHAERDFTSRTDYDNFKAVTGQTVTLTASKGANNSISILIPVAIKDTDVVNLSGQGDLVRSVITYQNIADASGHEYTYTIKTQENI